MTSFLLPDVADDPEPTLELATINLNELEKPRNDPQVRHLAERDAGTGRGYSAPRNRSSRACSAA